jgi:hypothetical protein
MIFSISFLISAKLSVNSELFVCSLKKGFMKKELVSMIEDKLLNKF